MQLTAGGLGHLVMQLRLNVCAAEMFVVAGEVGEGIDGEVDSEIDRVQCRIDY